MKKEMEMNLKEWVESSSAEREIELRGCSFSKKPPTASTPRLPVSSKTSCAATDIPTTPTFSNIYQRNASP